MNPGIEYAKYILKTTGRNSPEMRKYMHTQTDGFQNAREFILKSFSKRQRVNSVTDLEQLYRVIRAQLKTVTQDDIKAVFKELQDKVQVVSL